MTTLKTTKGLCAELQKRMSAANLDDQTDTLRLTRLEIKALCHDADRAEEMGALLADMYTRLEAGNLHLPYCNAGRDQKVGEAGSICCCPLGKEIADLRAKLDGAHERAAMVCEQVDADGEGPDCWDWHAKDYAKAIRALKEYQQFNPSA